MSIVRLSQSLRFVRAAPWPYFTGFASLLLALGLKSAGLAHWSGGDISQAVLFACWGGGWLVVALFAMADAVSRHRECERIKRMFRKYGYSERILEPLARSRCQRDAAIFAADEVGYGDVARCYFVELGYRWYHILPDLVVRNPFAFLRPSFLRASFLPGKKART
ncbi:hypothetical protein [uncultured Pseudodesulfovibrio sp.]|uniref:hypothetical protein n=1 Tax=uncultured Pseudodesulfovibrio sp. TaxID=2035858 RepID=UPI0029C6396B|nr:hypothetical protein [uncultured Pseudodesulfovibrio sp.]